jgi:hypothetical protein
MVGSGLAHKYKAGPRRLAQDKNTLAYYGPPSVTKKKVLLNEQNTILLNYVFLPRLPSEGEGGVRGEGEAQPTPVL